MATYTVNVKGSPVTFESDFSDTEVLERLGELTGTFARDLFARRTRLSAAQMAWAHKLVVDAARPRVAPVATGVTLKVIIELLHRAQNHLAWPAVVLSVNGQTFKMSLCGPNSKNYGSVNLTDGGRFGSNRYFGRIDPAGNLVAGRDMTPEVLEAVKGFAADPVGAAAAHGHKTGNCCFCRRELKDDRSTSVGYGQTCAAHYGLPWGTIAEPVAFQTSAA